MIFEMLAGYPPFYDDSPFQIYQKILLGKVEYPRHFYSNAKDLIRKLLQPDRSKRIGVCVCDCARVWHMQPHAQSERGAAASLRGTVTRTPWTNLAGNLRGCADDIRKHKWFKGLNWEAILRCEIQPPILPELRHGADTRNFEQFPEFVDEPAVPFHLDERALEMLEVF